MKLFKEAMKEMLENTSITNYINNETIDNFLSNIEVELGDAHNSSFLHGKIILPKKVYGKLRSIEDLKKLSSESVDVTYEMLTNAFSSLGYSKTDTEYDKSLKDAIAGYLASKEISRPDTVCISSNVFKVPSKNSSILETIIEEISLILGEKNIIMTLLSGCSYLSESIFKETLKKDLPQKFIREFISLDDLLKKRKTLIKVINMCDSLQVKLDVIDKLIKSNKTYIYPLLSSNMLELNGFNLKETFKKDDIGDNQELNDFEKRLTSILLSEFINKNDKYFKKDLQVKSNDLTLVDKVRLVIEEYRSQLAYIDNKIIIKWNFIQNLIMNSIVYSAYSNPYSDSKKIDIDRLIDLGSYRTHHMLNGLGSSKKVHRLKKKFEKIKKP